MYIPTRAERFESARTEYNIHGTQSIAEVSKATGINPSMICDLENDDKTRGVNYEAIATLAEHYGVFADYLMGLSTVPSTRVDEQAIEKYTGLSHVAVERLSQNNTMFCRDRDTLNALLAAESFPNLIDALSRVERCIKTANRAIKIRTETDNEDINLTLFSERLELAVFRVLKTITEICYEMFPVAETESRLTSKDE